VLRSTSIYSGSLPPSTALLGRPSCRSAPSQHEQISRDHGFDGDPIKVYFPVSEQEYLAFIAVPGRKPVGKLRRGACS